MTTTSEYIERAKKVHGNKYDYSLVNYKHSSIRVEIICHVHGEFQQFPCCHLAGFGCRSCAIDARRGNIKSFIKKAKKIHGDKYDYSKTIYKSYDEKIKIICPIHGEFIQRTADHLRFGCKARKIHGDNVCIRYAFL